MSQAEPRGRALGTRAALVAAAREVFLRSGYDAAGISEIVEAAGSSVGSLYHHFDGKAELWLAVYREHQHDLQRAVAQRYLASDTSGLDAFEMFLLGNSAYLDACWERRALVTLFADGDQPPGFGTEVRKQSEHWVAYNAGHLGSMPEPLSHTLVLVLTTLSRTAGQEVARRRTRAAAREIADEFLAIMRRLYPAGAGAS